MLWYRLSDRTPANGQHILLAFTSAPDANPYRVVWCDLAVAEEHDRQQVYWTPYVHPVRPDGSPIPHAVDTGCYRRPRVAAVSIRAEHLASQAHDADSMDYAAGQLTINGVDHHLTLIRVQDEGEQRGIDPHGEDDLHALQQIHPGVYRTITVPGLEGTYVAFLVPHAG